MRLTSVLLAFSLPTLAQAEPPRVLTDIAPVHSLAAMVMDGVGSPEMLLPQGADPHDFQLRPSEARKVADADLVFWVGPALTPQLARALENTGGEAVALFGGEAEDGHAHGDHGHAHGDHGHDEGEDPHVWLNPDEGSFWLQVIADHLAEADPANADRYAANATVAARRISAAAGEADALLAPVADRRAVVYHDAYDHFAERFEIRIEGSVLESDAARPGAGGLSELNALLRSGAVRCVFTEPGYNEALVANATEGADVRLAELDPTGSALEPGPELYPALILGLARTFAECLAD